jgi:hypothetical protein
MKLYRVTADHGPAGKDVDIDGWEDALDEAWRQVAGLPGVIAWLTAYVHARGDDDLIVSFGDTGRVSGRRARDYFTVSYPADLLMAGEDPVSAMRAAILVVLDRHVSGRDLDVPLLSPLVAVTL